MNEKKKDGRPKITWSDRDYEIFERLCSIQATLEELESVLSLDHKTIYRLCEDHYKDEEGKPMTFSQVYKKYSSTGKISLRRMQFKSAENGNVTMQIWLGRQYLGQTEKQQIEETNDHQITINVSGATKDDV